MIENHQSETDHRAQFRDGEPRHSALKMRWAVIVVLLLIGAAAAGVWVLSRGSRNRTVAGRPVPAPAGESATASSDLASNPTTPQPGEIVITLSPDKLANAKIETEAVSGEIGLPVVGNTGIRAAGTVQSNAYKEVPVFPIAGGIVRQINVELGNKVRRGAPLATIFSGELADAEAAYLKVAAEVEEHHLHHGRTTELVELGAASQEDLEQATTMYKTAQASLASARERLILLGLSEKQIDELRESRKFPKPLLTVEAPASGTLISRAVNPGEVVMQGKEMFRVADLSTVWVIAQIYEKDLQSINFNASAVVTAQAYPGKTLIGRISYVDPKVDPQTRTVQVRIELANPREMLKLGMFVDVILGGSTQAVGGSQPVVAVPQSALQTIGAKRVVFVGTDQPGSFIQREVSVGPETNGRVLVYSGISKGERVVTDGAFLLRAESIKLKPTQSMSSVPANAPAMSSPLQPQTHAQSDSDGVQTASVSVTEKGFQPATIKLRRGVLARLTFVRAIEETCATAIVIAEFNIKRDLPFKEPVVVEITPTKRGEFKFTCGMGMLSGKIIVE